MTGNSKLKVSETEIALLAEEVKRDMDSNAVNRGPEIMNTWKKNLFQHPFSAQEKYTLVLN